jgi:hypothetical protein
MASIPEATQTQQDEFLSGVRQNQQAVLDAVAAWARAVQEITPPVPSADALPAPETVVENAFDFAQKLLDAQRDFAQGIIAATAPARSTSTKGSSKAAKS